MRQNQHRIDELGIEIKVVTFEDAKLGQLYAQDTELVWPLLFDANRELYGAYGFERGSWWSIINPRSIFRYIKLILCGNEAGKPGSDWRQLGGDVLIDPKGQVRLQNASSGPHDRPSIDQICTIVEMTLA